MKQAPLGGGDSEEQGQPPTDPGLRRRGAGAAERGGRVVAIRVLIADDHSVIRAGLRTLLGSDPELTIVGEASDGPQTLKLAEELAPDVLLLDIGMPGEDGIQVARKLKAAHSQVRVLFLTMHEDEDLVREAVAAGASGYVPKRAEEAEILDAIRAAYRGDLYVHPALTRALVKPQVADKAPHTPSGEPLTPREVSVLKMLARGFTNRQIAETLGLAPHAVEGYRASLTAKLGLSSRIELVSYAEKHSLI